METAACATRPELIIGDVGADAAVCLLASDVAMFRFGSGVLR